MSGEVVLFATLADAEAAALRAAVNLRQRYADRRPRSEWRGPVEAGDIDVGQVPMSTSGVTQRWAEPEEILAGPHAGKWCLSRPPDDLTHERHPRTGEVSRRPSQEWAGRQVIVREDSWFAEPGEE